jgi:predicted alpha/beta superfamily hydrolase
LETELIPYIESAYPASRQRTLIGHSTGGLMAVDTLLKHPDLFTNYLAIDPSMWWDHQRLLNESKTLLRAKRYAGKTLLVSLANTLPNTMSMTKDITIGTLHFRSARQLVRLAKANAQNGLRFNWKYYPHETHGSVPFYLSTMVYDIYLVSLVNLNPPTHNLILFETTIYQ